MSTQEAGSQQQAKAVVRLGPNLGGHKDGFAFASLLILVGQFLRAKVPLVQRFFIPSSLLAGFLGFILGKQVLNVIPFSDSLSSYTSVLMIPIFAAIPIFSFI